MNHFPLLSVTEQSAEACSLSAVALRVDVCCGQLCVFAPNVLLVSPHVYFVGFYAKRAGRPCQRELALKGLPRLNE